MSKASWKEVTYFVKVADNHGNDIWWKMCETLKEADEVFEMVQTMPITRYKKVGKLIVTSWKLCKIDGKTCLVKLSKEVF